MFDADEVLIKIAELREELAKRTKTISDIYERFDAGRLDEEARDGRVASERQ
jgi:hypothetical protein